MARPQSHDFVLKADDDFAGVAEVGAICIRLRFDNKLKYDEIAGMLIVPVGTVKSRINRAKAQILANRAAKSAGVTEPPNDMVPSFGA